MACSKKMQDLNRMLECAICLERMKIPRILPCLHTYCEGCLAQHMVETGGNGSFLCPLCNAEYKVPQNGVTSVKRNIFLAEVSELFVESDGVKCDVCNIKNADTLATSMCLQCRDNLCGNCAQIHCGSRLTHNHRVVNLEEVRNGDHFEEIRSLQRAYCTVHEEEVLKLYCDNCAKPICVLCKALDHDQHKMKNIKDAALNADDVMKGLLVDWRHAAEHSAMMSAKSQAVTANIDEQQKQIADDIKDFYRKFKDEILQEIQTRQGVAERMLTAQVAVAKKQADVAYHEAEFNRLTITGTLRYVDQVLDSAHDVEKLQQFNEITTRLKSQLVRKSSETQITQPTFELRTNQIVIPDLSVFITTSYENKVTDSTPSQRISKQVVDKTRQPIIREMATLVRCVTTNVPCDTKLKNNGLLGSGLCVSDNRLITIDRANRKVKIFDELSGDFMFEVNQDFHKLQPWDVTCNKEGEMFVTDIGTNGVVRYDVKGQMISLTQNMFTGNAGDITCHEDQLFVTDPGGGRILVTDFDCNIKQVIDKTLLGLVTFQPRQACVINDGQLLVRDDSGWCPIYVIDNNQQPFIRKSIKLKCILGLHVCVDSWGNILVLSRDTQSEVVVISAASVSQEYKPIQFGDVNDPCALAISGPGEVAVLERYTGDVKIFKYADV